MKIRTDFVTNSSSSCFDVVLSANYGGKQAFKTTVAQGQFTRAEVERLAKKMTDIVTSCVDRMTPDDSLLDLVKDLYSKIEYTGEHGLKISKIRLQMDKLPSVSGLDNIIIKYEDCEVGDSYVKGLKFTITYNEGDFVVSCKSY